MRRVALLLTLVWASAAWAQAKTYLAVGDSVAYGFQPNDLVPSFGDKGYVKLYADWLKTQQGGVRPRLINIAIPGESTSSYYNNSEAGRLLNLNYFLNGYSQKEMLDRKVQQEKNAGRAITHLTFALGANDLLGLQSANFFALPFEDQKAIVDAALVAARPRIEAMLAQIRNHLPSVRLVVPGYYNPYGAYPGSKEDKIAQYGLPKLNALLASAAKRFRATFVSVYSFFLGQEGTLTWILEGDVHPRDAGYSAIGTQIVVSPPSSLYALP